MIEPSRTARFFFLGQLGNGRYWQMNGKSCAFAERAGNRNTAVMLFHNLLGHRQAQAAAFGTFAAGNAVEALKQMRQVLLRDAGTSVRDVDLYSVCLAGGADSDTAVFRVVLGGITDQIQQNLL